MMHIKPPQDYSAARKGRRTVFLAGSIDMGAAEDWQAALAQACAQEDILLLNPRRDDWDSSWEQRIDNAHFRGQVEWELQGMEDSDMIAMYFAPNTKAPVTMLELGIHAAKNPGKLVVCCPQGFWRKGNVDIVCARYGVRQVADLQALIAAVIGG